jgi:hypothetical protein
MYCYYGQYHSDNAISGIQLLVDSKDIVYFAVLFTLRERWGKNNEVNKPITWWISFAGSVICPYRYRDKRKNKEI